MTSVSPPKPWEQATATGLPDSNGSISSAMTASTAFPSSNPTSIAIDAPALPDRPNTLNSVVNQTASNFTNQSRFGSNAYSSPYSSPYSRFGGYGGGMYGGGMGGGMYGGGMYGGGIGGSMYGGGYGGGYGGYGNMPGDPNNPSLTQSWNQSTAATFQIMESIVGAFGGLAQMLESAYMTTHSSFFAMVSMAEQLGNLRQTLGSILGIYALMRWMRTLIAKLTGRPPPADATSLTPANFSSFLSGGRGAATPAALPDGTPVPPRPSKKPFIMFALAVFGLPYLMGKIIRAMARSQEEEMRRQQSENSLTYTNQNGEQVPLDPRKLEFCRVLYDYTPSSQSVGLDLEVKKGDHVAILSKTDPMGNASQWWRCRARDGKTGYLPSPYLQVVQRPVQRQQQAITQGAAETASAPGSRTTTLKGTDLLGERTKSLTSIKGPEVRGKPGDITAESFQKSAFYS